MRLLFINLVSIMLAFGLYAQEIQKTQYDLSFDDTVSASSVDVKLSPIIAAGKSIELRIFGGSAPSGSIAAIQWGSGSDWQTIRAGRGTFEFDIKKEFIGDGVKRFRLIRMVESGGDARIVAWFEAIVK